MITDFLSTPQRSSLISPVRKRFSSTLKFTSPCFKRGKCSQNSTPMETSKLTIPDFSISATPFVKSFRKVSPSKSNPPRRKKTIHARPTVTPMPVKTFNFFGGSNPQAYSNPRFSITADEELLITPTAKSSTETFNISSTETFSTANASTENGPSSAKSRKKLEPFFLTRKKKGRSNRTLSFSHTSIIAQGEIITVKSQSHRFLKPTKFKTKLKPKLGSLCPNSHFKTPIPKGKYFQKRPALASKPFQNSFKTPIASVSKSKTRKTKIFPKIHLQYPHAALVKLKNEGNCNPMKSPSPPANVDEDIHEVSYITASDMAFLLLQGTHVEKLISDLTQSTQVSTPYVIVDTRYGYEYDGGHLKGAYHLSTKEEIDQLILNHQKFGSDHRTVSYIFHCEKSVCRGPRAAQYFTDSCREKNIKNCKALVMTGGYGKFYRSMQNKFGILPNTAQPLGFIKERQKGYYAKRGECRSAVQQSWKAFQRTEDPEGTFDLNENDMELLK